MARGRQKKRKKNGEISMQKANINIKEIRGQWHQDTVITKVTLHVMFHQTSIPSLQECDVIGSVGLVLMQLTCDKGKSASLAMRSIATGIKHENMPTHTYMQVVTQYCRS